MARKRATACTTRTISFKTARGKRIVFRGRAGDCAPKKASAAQLRVRRALAAAGRKCARVGKPTSAQNVACLTKALG